MLCLLLGRFFSLDPTPEPRLVGVPRSRFVIRSVLVEAVFFISDLRVEEEEEEAAEEEEEEEAAEEEEEEEEEEDKGYCAISSRINSRIFDFFSIS